MRSLTHTGLRREDLTWNAAATERSRADSYAIANSTRAPQACARRARRPARQSARPSSPTGRAVAGPTAGCSRSTRCRCPSCRSSPAVAAAAARAPAARAAAARAAASPPGVVEGPISSRRKRGLLSMPRYSAVATRSSAQGRQDLSCERLSSTSAASCPCQVAQQWQHAATQPQGRHHVSAERLGSTSAACCATKQFISGCGFEPTTPTSRHGSEGAVVTSTH